MEGQIATDSMDLNDESPMRRRGVKSQEGYGKGGIGVGCDATAHTSLEQFFYGTPATAGRLLKEAKKDDGTQRIKENAIPSEKKSRGCFPSSPWIQNWNRNF